MRRLESTKAKSEGEKRRPGGRRCSQPPPGPGRSARLWLRRDGRRLSVFLFLLAAWASQLSAQETRKEQFIQQCSAAFKRLRDANKNLRLDGTYGDGISSTRRPAPEDLDEKSFADYDYAASGGREKLIFFRSYPGPFGRAVVANGARSFVLRHNGNRDTPFYLEFKDLGTPFTKMLEDFRREVVNATYTAAWIDLSQALESGFFSVGSITAVEDNGHIYQRIKFEYKPRDGNISLAVGWLLLDPKRYWTLRQFEVREEFRTKGVPPLTAYGRNVYTEGDDLPAIREVHFKQAVENKYKTTRTMVFRANSWRYEATPQKDFTLGAYGLGATERPASLTRRTDRTPYLAAAIAAVALAVALLLKRLGAGSVRKSGTT